MRTLIPVLFLICFIDKALCQSLPPDSLFRQQARQRAIALYEQAISPQSPLYNGNEYIQHDFRIKVHPFFESDSLRKGTISYYGIRYDDVPMAYDIVRDELYVNHLDGGYRLRLNSEHIDQFQLGQHQFVRLEADSLTGVKSGFYDVLYQGKSMVFARRIKTVLEDISTGVYKAEYLSRNDFLVRKDKTYYTVNSLGAALSVFEDQKKLLRKYLRYERINYKKETERAIVGLAKYYDSLTTIH